jgi:hypothetical protein
VIVLKKIKIVIFTLVFIQFSIKSIAQNYWQQQVDYSISITMDTKKHQYSGVENLTYQNNSPDTLHKVFFHLYPNAFQSGSMMDVRSQNILDPDSRVTDRIGNLSEKEIGYLKISELTHDEDPTVFKISQTILIVELSKPIPPHSSATFNLEFEGQVPLQIRRSGRDSFEGIDYSMAQWYPKMAEYDENGWHTSPYVGREFYAPWGNFEVDITIDKSFILAGTGILQNPNEIGYGYEDEGVIVKRKGSKLTWKFKAENVHDFVWAADKEYTQTNVQVPEGPLVRFFYVPGEETANWELLPEYVVPAFEYAKEHFGPYGWSEYSIIQGGDGGMEYPMATLVMNKKPTGIRSWKSLLGTVYHEMMHSWYQGMLATDESLYGWMDEGFTSYADAMMENEVLKKNKDFPLKKSYHKYYQWARARIEEPSSTHSDHYITNSGYSVGTYTKGAMSLEILGYIIGEENRDQGLLRYYNNWAFKHPDMYDFINVMEKQSDMELSWFFEYWINSTKSVNYSIDDLTPGSKSKQSIVSLSKIGYMPMPIDLVVTKKNGEQHLYYIPLAMMLGEKPNETNLARTVCDTWPWTHPSYELTIDIPIEDILKIEIDPSKRMPDIDQSDNILESGQAKQNQ